MGVPAFIRNHFIPPSKSKDFCLPVADESCSHPRAGGSRGNETDFPGGSPGLSGKGAERGEPEAGGTESGRGGGGGRPGAARHLPGSRGRWDGGQVAVTGGGVRAARPGKAAAGSPRVSAVRVACGAGGEASKGPPREWEREGELSKIAEGFRVSLRRGSGGGCFRVMFGRPRSEERCSRAGIRVGKRPVRSAAPQPDPSSPRSATAAPGRHPAGRGARAAPSSAAPPYKNDSDNHHSKPQSPIKNNDGIDRGSLGSAEVPEPLWGSGAALKPRVGGSRVGGGGLRAVGEGEMVRILLKQKVEWRVCTGAAPSLKDCNFLLWCLAGFATDINGNINSAWKVLNKTV